MTTCNECGRPRRETADPYGRGLLAVCICEPPAAGSHTHSPAPRQRFGAPARARCGAPEEVALASGDAITCPTCRAAAGLDPWGRMDSMARPATVEPAAGYWGRP